MSRFPDGFYKAKAVASMLGMTGTGKETIGVEYEITEGDYAGQRMTWYGYFTEKSVDRTLETLRTSGWTGDDVGEEPLPGLGAEEVSLVIEEETYEGVTRSKIKWVNRAGGLSVSSPMSPSERKAFGASLRGKVAAQKQASPPKSTAKKKETAKPDHGLIGDDGSNDIPF